MTWDEWIADLNAVNKTELFSRFGSCRTLANLLTESEYNLLASVLDAAAAPETGLTPVITQVTARRFAAETRRTRRTLLVDRGPMDRSLTEPQLRPDSNAPPR